jgi:hypothetical protein
METFSRKQAKEILAKNKILRLSKDEVLKILMDNYWGYDDEEQIRLDIANGELPKLSDDLINLIVTTRSPSFPLPAEVDTLLIDFMVFDFKYVTNKFLKAQLEEFGFEYDVHGEVEEAGLCPCCEFYSIDPGEDGLWDICPVCFWENGGDGPNHMSLSDAKSNFLKYGAISESDIKLVDPEGPKKYAKKA